MSVVACSRAEEAIQRSFAGIGVPALVEAEALFGGLFVEQAADIGIEVVDGDGAHGMTPF